MQWWGDSTPLIIIFTAICSISIPIFFKFWKRREKKIDDGLKDGDFGWIIPSKDIKFSNRVRFKEDENVEDAGDQLEEKVKVVKDSADGEASGSSNEDAGDERDEQVLRRPKLENQNDENTPNLAAFSENLSSVGMDVSMMDSLPGKMKKSKFMALNKKIEAGMTEDQKKEEAEVRRQQMEQIFRLMKEQEERLGVVSPEDVAEQMKLYAL